MSSKKKEAESGFHAVLADGLATPESVMIAVMRGETAILNGTRGRPRKLTPRMIDAAEKLLPYRLPKLNAVDAVSRNVEMTHEDWINEIGND